MYVPRLSELAGRLEESMREQPTLTSLCLRRLVQVAEGEATAESLRAI